MPLSREEQAELAALEAGGLSPGEQAELAALEAPDGESDSLSARLSDPSIWKASAKTSPVAKQGRPPGAPQEETDPMDRMHAVANTLPMMLGPAGAMGRIGVGAVAGAVENATDRHDPRPLPERTAMGALRGGTFATGGETVAKGTGKLADWLMQKAVGMKKYMPGVGNTLVDEGVVGTKGMMTGQAGKKLQSAEDELTEVAASIPGRHSPEPLANAASARGQKLVSPDSGITLPTVQGDLDKANDLSKWLRAQQPQSARDLVSLKRQGDWGSFTKAGDQATSMDADLGVAVADAARGELSRVSQGLQTTIPDILKREQALTLAKKSLEKPEAIRSGFNAVLHGDVPGSSLLGSVGAQATQKTGQLAKHPTLQQMLRYFSGGQ